MKTQLWAIELVICATTVGAFGPLFWKKASDRISFNIKSIFTNYYLLIAVISYVIGTALFIPALRGGELSVLYPIVALDYIWVSLLSIKFLGEKMNKMKWLGIGLIIAGVSLIGLGSIA